MLNVTPMDVKTLAKEQSGKVRSVLAAKLATDYRTGNFTNVEADIAADIFRILIKDVEKQVRKVLAEHLSHCAHVPRDVILKLANDDVDVATPILEHSSVLTDDDLVKIIDSTREVLKLCAIARRDNISVPISDRLINTHHEQVLISLFKNRTAAIAEDSLLESWSLISANQTLLETLVHRGGLPLTIAEKIYSVVTDALKAQLMKQYKISEPVALKAASDTKEWEMLGIIPAQGALAPANDAEVEDMVDQLYLSGRLTHSFLMRALCVGSLSVFEVGIARLAGVPRVNARILLMDSGALGFNAIYKTAAMPEGFAEAVRTLLRISLEETDFGQVKHADFRKRVIDRIYKEGLNRTVENMPYLLTIIGGKLAPAGYH